MTKELAEYVGLDNQSIQQRLIEVIRTVNTMNGHEMKKPVAPKKLVAPKKPKAPTKAKK